MNRRARRHPPTTLDFESLLAEMLRREIADIAATLDRRWGNRAGVALKGIYFWHDAASCGLATLSALHSDALMMLLAAPLGEAA